MQKVCNSEDGGLNDALKLARRVENDGVVASAALELSGSWATTVSVEVNLCDAESSHILPPAS